jgi:hypothetical protein
MDHRELSDRVERAGGVVRAGDVVGPGVVRSSFYDLARREGWQSPFAGAWMPPHLPLDGLARARGVLASLGNDDAWLARTTVLWLLGLVKKPPADVQVIVPDRRQPVSRPGATVVRSRTLRPDELTKIKGLPATTLARTVRDLCGARWTVEALLPICLDALQRRQLFLDRLKEQRRRMSRGCTGTRVLDLLISELELDGSDSALEKAGRSDIVPPGYTPYPRPLPWRARDGVVDHLDIAFLAEWVAVMCDSRAYHGAGRVFESDRRMWNSLSEDWEVLWLTTDILRNDPAGFTARLQRALDAAPRDREPARPVACRCSRCLTHR